MIPIGIPGSRFQGTTRVESPDPQHCAAFIQMNMPGAMNTVPAGPGNFLSERMVLRHGVRELDM